MLSVSQMEGRAAMAKGCTAVALSPPFLSLCPWTGTGVECDVVLPVLFASDVTGRVKPFDDAAGSSINEVTA